MIKRPLAVLKNGGKLVMEEYYKDKIAGSYGLERLPTLDWLDLFPGFREKLEVYCFLEGASTVLDVMLLKALARRFPSCEYLEIGTWRGETMANVAEVAGECVSLTLSAEEMRALRKEEAFIAAHDIFITDLDNVALVKHDSRTFDFAALNKRFDLIFIDGDHSYEGVLSDTRKCLPLRKGPESMIVWHDYGYSPETVRPEVLAAILDGVPRERHGNLFHVSNTLCAVYVENNRRPTRLTTFPAAPTTIFTVEVKAEKYPPPQRP